MICLDCEDPASLAAFWAGLLGGEVTPVDDDFIVVGNKGTPVAALRVPGYQPPTWPSGEIPKQVHLDLAVGDLDAAEAEAIRLGARRAGEQPRPGRWRVMLDPAGHPFCLCDWSQPLSANRKDPDLGPSQGGAPCRLPPGNRQSCAAVKVGRPSGLASGFHRETNACLLFVAGVSSLMEAL
jgi:Glyoxalase-like domain